MNASFRTAFRVLCFSLALPLALFVAVELHSALSPPGETRRTASLAVNRGEHATTGKMSAARPAMRAHAASADPVRVTMTTQTERAGAPRAEVILGPEVEPQDVARPAVRRSPARAIEIVREDPPAFRYITPPPVERPPARKPRAEAAIAENLADTKPAVEKGSAVKSLEARLVSIQKNIDRLAQVQVAQVQQQQQADQMQQATQLLQQLQQTNQLQQLEQQIQNLKSGAAGGAPNPFAPFPQAAGAPPPAATGSPPAGQGAAPLPAPGALPEPPAAPPGQRDIPDEDESNVGENAKSEPSGPAVLKASPEDDGSDRFSLQIKDAEITQVLEMLGQLMGKNILATKNVSGKVTVNLHQVQLEQGLAAILKAGNYVYEEEGDFIYVSSHTEADERARLARKIVTKVYRPYYVDVKDLRLLITPLLTPVIGKSAVTLPSEVGLATNASNVGGDSLSQRDALVVQDYEEVLSEIDRVFEEIDVPPTQVVIEAMILSVQLTDDMQFGVNFALLNKMGGNSLFVSGNGSTLGTPTASTTATPMTGPQATPVPGGTLGAPLANFLANTAGLKYGFLAGEVSTFINALEDIADTNLIATPHAMVLNKQRAELIIGSRLAYKTLAFNGTQTAENVNFLDAGTKLRIRPFIAPDGLVRMEIHPEKSSATIDASTGLPNLSTTEVTSNVMVKDGTTVVIGGLISEQVNETFARVPFFGALPLVGPFFRNKTENKVKTELIVLITPRIVNQAAAAAEGALAKVEGERRLDYFSTHTMSFNRSNLARKEYEQALYYYEQGDMPRAQKHIVASLRQSKNELPALRLQDRIVWALAHPGESPAAFVPPDSPPPELPPPAAEPASASNSGEDQPLNDSGAPPVAAPPVANPPGPPPAAIPPAIPPAAGSRNVVPRGAPTARLPRRSMTVR